MTQDQAVADGVDEILHGKPAAQHQGNPVAYTTAGMLEIAKRLPLTGRIGAKATKDERWNIPLFLGQGEQPALEAVVMPEDWEDQLFAEVSRRFDLRKQIDDDHMVYDDTQVGVEFARDWLKQRLTAK